MPTAADLHGRTAMAVWGEGDEIFGPDGARAFARDLPGARIHLLPGGHFLLESAVDQVADLIRDFLGELPSDHLAGRSTLAIR